MFALNLDASVHAHTDLTETLDKRLRTWMFTSIKPYGSESPQRTFTLSQRISSLEEGETMKTLPVSHTIFVSMVTLVAMSYSVSCCRKHSECHGIDWYCDIRVVFQCRHCRDLCAPQYPDSHRECLQWCPRYPGAAKLRSRQQVFDHDTTILTLQQSVIATDMKKTESGEENHESLSGVTDGMLGPSAPHQMSTAYIFVCLGLALTVVAMVIGNVICLRMIRKHRYQQIEETKEEGVDREGVAGQNTVLVVECTDGHSEDVWRHLQEAQSSSHLQEAHSSSHISIDNNSSSGSRHNSGSSSNSTESKDSGYIAVND